MSQDSYESQVRRFHVATGQPAPSVPTMPDAETRALRVRLLLEEVLEFANASGVEVLSRTNLVMRDGSDFEVRHASWLQPVLRQMAHEATDVLYVAVGNLVTMGAPVDACFVEVSAANLRKAPGGKVQRRADGKVLKPEGWQPADVGAVLARAHTHAVRTNTVVTADGKGSAPFRPLQAPLAVDAHREATETTGETSQGQGGLAEVVRTAMGTCEHDVRPDEDKPGFGRCCGCGEEDFPLGDEAAYGAVKCIACKDTGLVSVNLDGKPGVRADGTMFVHWGTLADGPCPAPGCEAGREARAATGGEP